MALPAHGILSNVHTTGDHLWLHTTPLYGKVGGATRARGIWCMTPSCLLIARGVITQPRRTIPWTRVITQQFINILQQHPCLWQMKNNNYNKTARKSSLGAIVHKRASWRATLAMAAFMRTPPSAIQRRRRLMSVGCSPIVLRLLPSVEAHPPYPLVSPPDSALHNP